MDAQTTQEAALREAFAPFANGRTVYLPVDREARKYRPIGGDEFMLMRSDADGHWLKHCGTRNYLLVRRDATVIVIVGKHDEPFLDGFYGEALGEDAPTTQRSGLAMGDWHLADRGDPLEQRED